MIQPRAVARHERRRVDLNTGTQTAPASFNNLKRFAVDRDGRLYTHDGSKLYCFAADGSIWFRSNATDLLHRVVGSRISFRTSRTNFDAVANCGPDSNNIDQVNLVPLGVVVQDCDADIDGNDAVDAVDLAQLLANWETTGPVQSDLNQDGVVNASDLAILLSTWGPCE